MRLIRDPNVRISTRQAGRVVAASAVSVLLASCSFEGGFDDFDDIAILNTTGDVVEIYLDKTAEGQGEVFFRALDAGDSTAIATGAECNDFAMVARAADWRRD